MASYGLTLLQIVNRVLERLRETAVVNYDSTDYSKLIAHKVNQVKSEIESAWHWHSLRDTYTVAATLNNASYAFTDAGSKAIVLDGWNRTYGNEILKSTNRQFNRLYFGTPAGQSVPTGIVDKFVQTGVDTNLDIKVDVYPPPSGDQSLVFNLYVPQDDMAANATVCRIPQNVLVEEVIARALAERGEEGAQPPMPGQTFIRTDLLAAAIVEDASADPSETDWELE